MSAPFEAPRIRAWSEPYWQGVSLCAWDIEAGKPRHAMPLVFKEGDPFAAIQPFVQLSNSRAQELMDDLWRCGLRPSEGTGSAGAFAAQGRHLEDLRALVSMLMPRKLSEVKSLDQAP